MAETAQFQLPLIAPSQAQKHVTVNEALSVLDCVSQLRVLSASVSVPPAMGAEGDAFLVPVGATDAWAGFDGQLAVRVNGGWRFVTPKTGWQCFNVETGTNLLFDGTEWLDSTLVATVNGSATTYEIVEVDVALTAGATVTTQPIIPQNALVTGVTARVLSPITGSLASWQLGVPGFADRYGSGLGLQLNSYALGLTGSPVAYYAPEAILLTASGGDFAGGSVRLAVHLVRLVPPRPA